MASLKKFSVFITITLVIKLFSTFFGIFTNRWLNTLQPNLYADFNQITAFTTILLAVLLLGFPQIIQKIYTQKHTFFDRKAIWTATFFLRLLSYFLGILLIFLFQPFTSISNIFLLLATFSVQFLLVVDLHYRAVADATGKSILFSLTDFFAKSLVFFLLLISLNFLPFFNIWVYVLILGFSYLVGLILDAFLFRKMVGFVKFSEGLKSFLKHKNSIFFLSANASLIALYSGVDVLLLGRFGFLPEQINSYSNAYKIYSLILIIPGIFIPTFASITFKNYNFLAGFLKKTFLNYIFTLLFLALVGILTAFLTFLSAKFLLQFIDPNLQYFEAIQVLQVLALSFCMIFCGSYISYIFIFLNKEKYEIFVSVLVFCCAILAYFFAIPKFGINGAAWVTFGYLFLDFILKLILSFWLFFNTKINQKDNFS